MTALANLLALLLHLALMAAAAPTLVGTGRWIEARLAGRAGPPVLDPWRELARLVRKQEVIAEGASEVSTIAPLVCAAATALATCLVPSFARGMTSAPVADLLVIAGLLALARCSLALAAMDAGAAAAGMVASRTMLLACLSEPALLVVVFALGLLAGSLDLDLVAAMRIESGADWGPAITVALAALLLVGLIDAAPSEALTWEFSGSSLAIIQVSGAMRLLVWFNLIGAMLLPFGMAPSGGGAADWAIGAACWLARTALFVVALAFLRTLHGRIRPARAAHIVAIAMAFGLLASLFLFADMGSSA